MQLICSFDVAGKTGQQGSELALKAALKFKDGKAADNRQLMYIDTCLIWPSDSLRKTSQLGSGYTGEAILRGKEAMHAAMVSHPNDSSQVSLESSPF